MDRRKERHVPRPQYHQNNQRPEVEVDQKHNKYCIKKQAPKKTKNKNKQNKNKKKSQKMNEIAKSETKKNKKKNKRYIILC